jgi:hypothetical protein
VKPVFLLACAVALFGQQGTEPKLLAEYPVHAMDGEAGVGAEYTVHSFSRGEAYYLAKDYLVVEVAVFPKAGETVAVRSIDFSLRVNGRKQTLLPGSPEMVAASLSHPEWRTADPHIEVAAGAGNGSVIYGAPTPQRTQYPSDPRIHPVPVPPNPKDDPTGIEHAPPLKAEDLVVQVALPEGPAKRPVSGFLYFAYTGRPSSIKSLELLYNGAVLKLK